MGFGLLAPLFLAALAALVAPVLVHLSHRERKQPVAFPSLMFLRAVPFRRQRRQRLRNLLLFTLRAALVALLAVAFARPFLSRTGAAPPAASDAILLIDRSASMRAAGRWARARDAALAAVRARRGGGRITLAAVDQGAEVLLEAEAANEPVEAALARLRPGDGPARLAAAVAFAAERLSRGGGGEIILVSDFQRAGFERGDPVPLPAGVTLTPVDVGGAGPGGAGVVGVSVEPSSGSRELATVSARLAAAGDAERRITARLLVEGRVAATETVTVQPGGVAAVRFPVRLGSEGRRARIELPPDDFPADDLYHFVLKAPPSLGLLVLTPGDRAGDAVYVRHAAAVAREPRIAVSTRPARTFGAADLAAAGVVLIHDAPFPETDRGRELLEWVRSGGGLFIALGERGTIPAALADSLGSSGAPSDRGSSGAAPAVTDPGHEVFRAWGPRAAEALAGARTWRYRRLDAARGVLARYDDGTAALAAMKYGEGRVLVWTADLANRWSDLAVAPAFVPLMLGAVRYLGAWRPSPPAYSVGETAELAGLGGSGPIVSESPSGERRALAHPARLPLTEAGVWAVRRAGTGTPALLVAANPPPAEADPARFDPATLVAPGSGAGRPSAATASRAERESRQRLWWYVLAAALLVVAAETVVAHRSRSLA